MTGLHPLEVDGATWKSFVARQKAAIAFHEPAWAELLAECYGYRTFAVAAIGSDHQPIAGLPVVETKGLFTRRRQWISLPFTDLCPPLAADPEAEAEFATELENARVAAGVERVEVRSDLALPGAQHMTTAVRHTLQLETEPSAVFRRMSKSQVQRNVNRARREQVVVRRAEHEEDLDRVFFDLQLDTRRRLGVPIQPRRFYTLLWRRMLEPGHGFLLLAYHGGRPIAGAVFLQANDTLIYKYSASLKSHWHLRANALILWTAIELGCTTGMQVLDFGRTDLHHEGLRRFKRNWASEELPLTHTVLGRPMNQRRERTLASVEPIIRRSPPWVCQVAGELLYKYAS